VTGQWTNEVIKIGLGKEVFTVLHYTGPARKGKWQKAFAESDLVITR